MTSVQELIGQKLRREEKGTPVVGVVYYRAHGAGQLGGPASELAYEVLLVRRWAVVPAT